MLFVVLLFCLGCGNGDNGPTGPFSDPHTVMPASELPQLRDWMIRRGIIHCHSPYSHDACDDEGVVDGVRNEECFQDLRDGMCQTGQDFVFLTDHDDYLVDFEFPDTLQYAPGDVLIERGGLPVANRVQCGDGSEVIVAAGLEEAMMPIGLEHHLGDTPAERKAAYGEATPEAAQALKDAGALVFIQHTEGWSISTILSLPLDGIEIFNLHQCLMMNFGAALEMLVALEEDPDSIPIPELGIISVFVENHWDLERWALAALERPTPGIVATDVHRNTFPGATYDGERIDSYRRMMHWFSNYALVPQGELDDKILKEAIGAGRTYGAFDYLGYPVGFDFHAEAGGTIYEMGDNPPDGAELIVVLPEVYKLDPEVTPPAVTGHILKAKDDGTWEEVESGDGDLTYTAGPGVYRAEVRSTPLHLKEWLGSDSRKWLVEYVWIYSNPIYVGTW